ncbi:hypothetical protein AB0A05_26910 [Streptomyces sp. NPDC046374]|uniref:hypothetical protein n=1 Tax=Streptomyces sp. NPDC046374 TaxID=3154917 RepID=UPI0033DCFA58
MDATLQRIAETNFVYDPQSVDSMVTAARQLRDAYRTDSFPYVGTPWNTEGGAQRTTSITREYGIKALGMVIDLADVPAEPTPAGLPTPDVAARLLGSSYLGYAYPWFSARDHLRQQYDATDDEMTTLLRWMVTAGYVYAARFDMTNGRVMELKRGRELYHDVVAEQQVFVGEQYQFTREGGHRARSAGGRESVIVHPDTVDQVLGKIEK